MGYEVRIGVIGTMEIDFVATKADTTIYIQVTYLLVNQETINREFGNLLAVKDNYKKYVISLDDIKITDYKGIIHLRPGGNKYPITMKKIII